jgi:hypothetical protein
MALSLDWKAGDADYTASMLASNLRAIRAQFAALFGSGGRDAIKAVIQLGRKLTFTTIAGASLGPVLLPYAQTNPKGAKIFGRYYDEGDTYVVNGSTYVTLVGHNAGILTADLAAGNVTLLAGKGADAQVSRGAYSSANAYTANDVVYLGNPATADVSYYQAFFDVAAGGSPPPAFPWGLLATSARQALPVSVTGPLPAGKRLWGIPVPQTGFLPANLGVSRFTLAVATTNALVLSLRKNGTEVATISFAAGAKVSTLATPPASVLNPVTLVSLLAGDELSIVSPASADPTAADLGGMLMVSLTS